MKKTLSEKEEIAIKRISELIRRKLVRLGKARTPVSNIELPVTLTELVQYQKGLRAIPLCDLVQLFKFYGCSEPVMAEWNVKVSVLAFRALKKARGERNLSRPEMDL
jgi:hypothetical protein